MSPSISLSCTRPRQFDYRANAALASISSDQEANMELVLYGVVSLYERFPPKTGDATPGS